MRRKAALKATLVVLAYIAGGSLYFAAITKWPGPALIVGGVIIGGAFCVGLWYSLYRGFMP